MTRPRAAILGYCGYRQVPEQSGLWGLYQRIKLAFWDGRRFPLIALRTWNADVRRDADLVRQWDCEKLVVFAHSYGVGNATYHLERVLDRPIDLLISIDGVQRYGWFGNGVGFLPKLRAFRRGGTIRFENVRRAASFVSLNDAGWFCPMGHLLEGPEMVRNVVYGGAAELESARALLPPGTLVVRDPVIDHFSIDNDGRVHDSSLHLIREELGLPAEEAAPTLPIRDA